jgi:hypothetical protein
MRYFAAPTSEWLFVLGLWGLCEFITLCSDLRLGWSLKQTCSSPWELSNSVSHSTCTHRGRVDSRLLIIGSQIGSLTPGPSFCHNLCCTCPNGSCEAIFDIYTSIVFQWLEEHLKERCFDPCNWVLKFWESQRTSKSPFREWVSSSNCSKSGVATSQVLISGERVSSSHSSKNGVVTEKTKGK